MAFDPSVLESTTWEGTGAGRPAKDSIYKDMVQYAVDNPPAEGEAFKFTAALEVDGKPARTTEDQAKALTYHKNQLQRAGSQVTPDAVTVNVVAGPVNAKGLVQFTFRPRPKITRKAATA